MSRYTLTFVSATFEKSSEIFKNLIWNDLKQQAQKHSNVRILEIDLTDPTYVELNNHHPDLRRFVSWLPTIGLFDDESWVTPTLTGQVYGGTMFGAACVSPTPTTQKPYEWLVRSIHQPRYVLVSHCNIHEGIGQRFHEGPWKKFLEHLPCPEDYIVHVVGKDFVNPTFPSELHRWLSWSPSVMLFTKESWDSGDLEGWIFQGEVDKHWSNDCVVTQCMTNRYEHTDLLDWISNIVPSPEVQCVDRSGEKPKIAPTNVEPPISSNDTNVKEINDEKDAVDVVLDTILPQETTERVEAAILNEAYIC